MISLFWRLIMMNATSSYFLVSQIHFRRFAGLCCPPHVFLPVETWKWSRANGRWWNTDVVHTQEKLILKYYLQELLRTNSYYSPCTHTHKIKTNSQSCRHEFDLKIERNKQTNWFFYFNLTLPIRGDGGWTDRSRENWPVSEFGSGLSHIFGGNTQ